MKSTSRRKFLKRSMMAAGAAVLASPADFLLTGCSKPERKKITISGTGLNFESEPLIRPFGFKGGFMKEIWQTISFLKSSSGAHSIGLCSQSVLWSDANVFAANSESAGNALMYSMTDRALRMLERTNLYQARSNCSTTSFRKFMHMVRRSPRDRSFARHSRSIHL